MKSNQTRLNQQTASYQVSPEAIGYVHGHSDYIMLLSGYTRNPVCLHLHVSFKEKDLSQLTLTAYHTGITKVCNRQPIQQQTIINKRRIRKEFLWCSILKQSRKLKSVKFKNFISRVLYHNLYQHCNKLVSADRFLIILINFQ